MEQDSTDSCYDSPGENEVGLEERMETVGTRECYVALERLSEVRN